MAKVEHKPNQNARILDYIEKHGGITQFEADRHLGVARLASRISDLKRKGYVFTSVWVEVENRYGEKCRVKRYRLEGETNGRI